MRNTVLALKVAVRYAAEQQPAAYARVFRSPKDEAIPYLIAEGKKRKLDIRQQGIDFAIYALDPMKPKELKKAFESSWGAAHISAYNAGIDKPGFSALQPPKIEFTKDEARERGTGRYIHTKWTRLCKCGHPVGIHSGEKVDGQQPCFASDYGIDCDCEQFKPTSKFMSDEEYNRLYKR